ncbi:hypothetical protein EAI_13264 [Harpegnathos saltator]|uniref:Uncharacterized protein n=1 Tax=Harpegnathos saltator TaxID=610380 RepID=E2C4V6_HARSA|nr:hypothetical protein EAI_13264 [Harpegnathos saltator]
MWIEFKSNVSAVSFAINPPKRRATDVSSTDNLTTTDSRSNTPRLSRQTSPKMDQQSDPKKESDDYSEILVDKSNNVSSSVSSPPPPPPPPQPPSASHRPAPGICARREQEDSQGRCEGLRGVEPVVGRQRSRDNKSQLALRKVWLGLFVYAIPRNAHRYERLILKKHLEIDSISSCHNQRLT